MADGEMHLLPVEPDYKNVLRVRIAIPGLVLAVGSFVADRLLLVPIGLGGTLAATGLIFAALLIVIAPDRIYRRLRYGVGEQILQVVRGWLFHTDTIVPLVRVQHLDVVRGPFDKIFGTASLVVHTAGTHNSIVTVPGLAPERASEMRDIIRQHVSADAS